MTELIHFDEHLFHLINQGLQNAFFDWMMPWLRNKLTWVPLYLFLGAFLVINFRRTGLFIILLAGLTVGVSDFSNSQLLKKGIKRVRPCHIYKAPEEMNLLVPCGGGYSFPSSHAANHFALATVLTLLLSPVFRWIGWPLFLWAFAVAFAQVYVGVHYPLDVLCGALVGVAIGLSIGIPGRKYIRTGLARILDQQNFK